MTRNDAARRFWARQDAAQRRRDAEHERHVIARAADCTGHVEVWEAFEGFARLLGRERATAIWARDMAAAASEPGGIGT